MLASSRKTLRCRKAPAAGEIARPTKPPGAGGNAQTSAIRQARRQADAIIGPYAGDGAAGRRGKLPDAGAPSAVPRSTARLPCIVGRAFTPAGEVCGGPEGYWHGKAPHPSVGFADSSPCRGAFRAAVPQSLPCKGRWMRRKAQTEGCIASLRRRYPEKSGRGLPHVS